tara:strand:+ start:1356 stop:1469 length:114 start_codon:yes stop_codon:yes gene_type:complete
MKLNRKQRRKLKSKKKGSALNANTKNVSPALEILQEG